MPSGGGIIAIKIYDRDRRNVDIWTIVLIG
jgi:hypothetical protein